MPFYRVKGTGFFATKAKALKAIGDSDSESTILEEGEQKAKNKFSVDFITNVMEKVNEKSIIFKQSVTYIFSICE